MSQAALTVLLALLGYRQVSAAPLVKLQNTLKESREQPWLGSIQYSPAVGDRELRTGGQTATPPLHHPVTPTQRIPPLTPPPPKE